MRAAPIFACVLALVASATSLSAQDADREEAGRALAAAGMEDVRRGDYAPALTKLLRALELRPHAGTAYNLAELHHRMANTLAELALLDALLEGTYGVLSEAQAAQAQSKRDAAASAVATLRVTVRGPSRAELRIDGARVGELRAGRAHEARVNPGTRRVFVNAPGHESAEEEVSIGPGATENVEVTLARVVVAERAQPSAMEERPTPSASRRRRILGITLGAVLLVAGGVTAALLVRRGNEPEISGVTVVGW